MGWLRNAVHRIGVSLRFDMSDWLTASDFVGEGIGKAPTARGWL